jgi:hypothetical protein
VKVTLSEQFQVSESLVEECEVVDEAMPQRRVVWIGGFIAVATKGFCQNNVRIEGSMTVCVQLVGDSHGGGVLITTCACSGLRLWPGTMLVTTAWVAVAFF